MSEEVILRLKAIAGLCEQGAGYTPHAFSGMFFQCACYAREALLAIEDWEEPCRHFNCETRSGRKKDYLYCYDCETALGDDE